MPRLIGCLVVMVFCAGCGGPSVRLRGVAPLNRNAAGESTPVAVRLYPLRGEARFQGAAFEALWTDAERILGPDLIAPPTVVTVLPGAAGDPPQRVLIDGGLQAQWIGVVALVRRNDGNPRTAVLPAERADDGVIELTGYGLRLPDRAPVAAPAVQRRDGGGDGR